MARRRRREGSILGVEGELVNIRWREREVEDREYGECW